MEDKMVEELKNAIRDVPDFPKKGIIFKDITTLIKDRRLFKETIDIFVERYKEMNVDVVACIESRGFIFGGAIAYGIGAGIVPIRKKGKLPAKTISETYTLEYGEDTLEIHEDGIRKGQNVVLVDDLLATGGTTKATANLIKRLGGNLLEIGFLIELEFLKGREKLREYNVFSIIRY